MLAHYGLEPRMIHRASPNENGDVEAATGRPSAPSPAPLAAREPRLPHVAAYERFVVGVFEKRNAGRRARLARSWRRCGR